MPTPCKAELVICDQVIDFTYVPTGEGWLYPAFVLDVYSRRIVGRAMAAQQRAEPASSALATAVSRRQPRAGLIHHSDRGPQYKSVEFGRKLQQWSVSFSMGARDRRTTTHRRSRSGVWLVPK